MITIKRGLDIPILGAPEQKIGDRVPVKRVALVAADYVGMKPTMEVVEGDDVKLGQVLFTDKKIEGVRYTAPASGRVVEVNRGEKRRFLSVVIEQTGDDEQLTFPTFGDRNLATLARDDVKNNLLESGLWTALRERPFSKVAHPLHAPHSIFVTAMDTHPLAVDPQLVIAEHEADFEFGLRVLSRLTEGAIHVCKAPAAVIPGGGVDRVRQHEFAGPHPAGLPGTHIHFLDPVGPRKQVWYIGYQDVIAIGKLFTTGRLWMHRVVSIAGPAVKQPRIIRTQVGASITELLAGQLTGDDVRVVSGSVLAGRTAAPPTDYLGRYHVQISALEEGRQREFLGWQMPGANKFSITRLFASSLLPGKRFNITTSLGGSRRAMVPIGSYEKVMPLDILPTQLLRSLITHDTEQAQLLGALELDEEDVALCTFVCPGKYEYGDLLRENLSTIEREG